MFVSADIDTTKRAPTDDYWYYPVGMPTAAGVRVSHTTALAVTAFFAGVQLLARTLGKLPLILYKRKRGGGKERATEHPLYKLMQMRPNPWQSPFQWKQMGQWHTVLRGNGYNRINYAPNGEILSLTPLHPDRTAVEDLSKDERWNYRYRITRKGDGTSFYLLPGEVLHWRGLASDGILGLSCIDIARESIGEALAAQHFSARMLANDAKPGGWIKHPAHFRDKGARREFRESWQESQTGENRGKVAVLEHGMEFKELGFKPVDLQFIEGRKLKDVDMARILGVQPHKIGILDRATFSNIEHQGIEFVVDTMLPWLKNHEEETSWQLLTEDEQEDYFFEFLIDALLRGDSQARANFYSKGILDGWLVRNEVRERENLNPLPGLDKPLEPMNMRGAGERQDKQQQDKTQEDDAAQQDKQRQEDLEDAAAQRVARKEVAAMERAAQALKGPDGMQAFGRAVSAFFATHGAFVADVMLMDRAAADAYAVRREREILGAESGAQNVIDSWRESGAAELVILSRRHPRRSK